MRKVDNKYGYDKYQSRMRLDFSFSNTIQEKIIDYVQGIFDSGYDGYSDDILIDGFKSGMIDINQDYIIHNYGTICMEMDKNFDDSNLAIGYMRFLLRLLKTGMFNIHYIKKIIIMYGLNEYAVRTYTDLNDTQIVKLMNEVRETRESVEY